MRWILFRQRSWLLLLAGLLVAPSVRPYQTEPAVATQRQATVLGVSAMCGLNGITVSIEFDQPFTGKIYSYEYANVHECIYYNALEMKNVLFTIPLHRCGTRLTRNTRDVIDTVENRIYVQMEKFTQTSLDRQYSFLCELVHSHALLGINGAGHPGQTNEIRRSPARSYVNNNLPVVSNQAPIVPARSSLANAFPLPSLQVPPLPQFNFNTVNPVPPVPSNVGQNQQSQAAHSIVPTNMQVPNLFPWMNNRQPLPQPPLGLQPVQNVNPQRSAVSATGDANRQNQGTVMPGNGVLSTNGNQLPNAVIPVTPSTTPAPLSNSIMENAGGSNAEGVFDYTQKVPVHSSAEPVRVIAMQHVNKTEALGGVGLEIQEGEGPRASPVKKPVKIGDVITLVIRNTNVPKDGSRYNIFVHSCTASDGPGSTKIDLIDKNGCATSSQINGHMKRERSDDSILYYFKMTAFKFPGPDDVYFSCFVDVSPNYNFPDPCVNGPGHKSLNKRDLITAPVNSIPLYNDIKVNLEDMEYPSVVASPESYQSINDPNQVCVSQIVALSVIAVSVVNTFGFILSFSTVIFLLKRLRQHRKK
uniref:ZP domain-containing protein n=1 Tax=Panagrellus redivivus TaxID=6233 RepID=A0A7E4UVQ6_PANRE